MKSSIGVMHEVTHEVCVCCVRVYVREREREIETEREMERDILGFFQQTSTDNPLHVWCWAVFFLQCHHCFLLLCNIIETDFTA